MAAGTNHVDLWFMTTFYGLLIFGPIAAALFVSRFMVPSHFPRIKRAMRLAEIVFATIVYATVFLVALPYFNGL